MKAVFIGAGSMAEAILAGALDSGILTREHTYVTNRANAERLDFIHHTYGVETGYEQEKWLKEADMIILAMKPKDARAGIESWKKHLPEQAVIVSVLAGISLPFIEEAVGRPCAVIRSMPNTSAAVGKSATAIALNGHVTDRQKKAALSLFSSIGTATVVEESQLDAVTAVSGSGPAYFYYMAEAMQEAGESLGLDAETTKELLIQTLLGSAAMLAANDGQSVKLRKAITSPGGTTEAAIRTFDEHQMKQAIMAGVKEAAAQSKRLGEAFSR